MTSVTTVQRNMQTTFKIGQICDNLRNNQMAKIMDSEKQSKKKKYPLLFTRKYNAGRRQKYE